MVKNNTVYAKGGKKKLSRRYASKSQALKRLREIEYFAAKKG